MQISLTSLAEQHFEVLQAIHFARRSESFLPNLNVHKYLSSH